MDTTVAATRLISHSAFVEPGAMLWAPEFLKLIHKSVDVAVSFSLLNYHTIKRKQLRLGLCNAAERGYGEWRRAAEPLGCRACGFYIYAR